jgi:hypothetical protein
MPSTPSRTSRLKFSLSLTVQARITSLCACTQVTRFASTKPWKTDTPPMAFCSAESDFSWSTASGPATLNSMVTPGSRLCR